MSDDRMPRDASAPNLAQASGEWHALPAAEVVALLGTDLRQGLAEAEVQRRRQTFGPNQLVAEPRLTFWSVAREEIAEPMILLLLAVGVLYSLLGKPEDALAIFAIIAGIISVEIYNEYRAKAAIAALGRLAVPVAPVVRDGQLRQVAAEHLVPGDLVLLRAGERVPADLRLVETAGLQIDEASLTGESVPVAKGVAPVAPTVELGDRHGMAYAGTQVVAGKGKGVVVAIGMATELGRIAGLTRAAREPRTPLQQAMRELSGWLVWVALGFSILVPTLGFLYGQPLVEMVLTGLTLAFATIPEELPILITVVLGLGAYRLSQRQAIVKRLRAAETLGSVSAIAADKTGTLTENRMALERAYVARQFLRAAELPTSLVGRRLLEVGVLASDEAAVVAVQAPTDAALGDPTEIALVVAAREAGLAPDFVRGAGPIREYAFDDRLELASAAYARGEGVYVAVKGSPEAVLARCRWEAGLDGARELDDDGRSQALAAAGALAGQGLRVLGLAAKWLPDGLAEGEPSRAEVEAGLTFVGLAGLLDPPRPEVPAAVAALRRAGIRVLMLTGDHPATARAVARAIGLPDEPLLVGREVAALDDADLARAAETTAVYARIAPEHKLRIVRSLQARGETVAVTGDGINDAPALRQAAIGVAMGETGTDAAREAADVVLADDNFATIAAAVREGRILFANLRKAVRYYLAIKLALVTTSLVAVLAQLPVPFAPIQIIVMELFMDLGASVAFTTEPPEADVMSQAPRDPRRPFVDAAMRLGILAGAVSLAVAVTAVYLYYGWWRGADQREAQTAAFAAWMLGHLSLAFNMRSERQPLWQLGLFSNRALLVWAGAALLLLVAAVHLPPLQVVLRTTSFGLGQWLVVAAVALLAPAWLEVAKVLRWVGKNAEARPPRL